MQDETTYSIPTTSRDPFREKVVVVTGASSGLGLETTRALAKRGARIIMAGRSVEKAREGRDAVLRDQPDARIDVRKLDLSKLESVRDFSRDLLRDEPRLDLLINNAGISSAPLTLTPEKVDLQFASNHLGHFALTGLLLERLSRSSEARIVTVSSMMIRKARLDLDNLDGSRGFKWMDAYARSKLANALFGFELDRRLREAGSHVQSIVSHPGLAATPMHDVPGLLGVAIKIVSVLTAKPPAVAVITQVHAATSPEVQGGAFIGPAKRGGGVPMEDDPGVPARDLEAAKALWELSERLTGVTFPF